MDVWEFAKRLDLIARHNRDDFSYRFDLHPRQRRWELTVTETADQHGFVGAVGATPEDCCAAAWTMVGSALRAWNYSWPDQMGEQAFQR